MISVAGTRSLVMRSAVVLLFTGVLAYAGCEYSISGNPDVDLVKVRLSPEIAMLYAGGAINLTASIGGTMNNASLNWSITGDTASHLAVNGLTATYTAPDTVLADELSVTITVRSNEDPTKSAQCVLTVINNAFSAGDVIVNPLSVSLLTSNPLQFSATVYQSAAGVTWRIENGPGTISTTGLYTPPPSAADNTQVVLSATSNSDSTKIAFGSITLINATDSIKCFSRDILPILTANCGTSDCHGGGRGAGGLSVDSYEGVIRSVTPGNARGSRMYQAITTIDRNSRMPPPPHPTLSPRDVQAIGQWIDEGAMNTSCQ